MNAEKGVHVTSTFLQLTTDIQYNNKGILGIGHTTLGHYNNTLETCIAKNMWYSSSNKSDNRFQFEYIVQNRLSRLPPTTSQT